MEEGTMTGDLLVFVEKLLSIKKGAPFRERLLS